MAQFDWDAFAPREAAVIRSLADYADQLFPGEVAWQISDELFAFEVRGVGHLRIWVALDQWIVLESGVRHWEIPYGDDGEAEARRVLLGISERSARRR